MQNYQWDVVFACSGKYVNKALATATSSTIKDFRYEDSAILLEGSFGIWQLQPDGSSVVLQITTPIVQGSITIKSQNKTYSLAAVVPLVQMQLTFVDKPASHEKHLLFNCTVVGKHPNDQSPGAVTVIDADTTKVLAGRDPDGMVRDLLIDGLAACLVANREKLSFIFAAVTQNLPANSTWLMPKQMFYAYQQDVANELGALCVLIMLSDSPTPKTHVFDTALLRAEDDFGFILAGRQFLSNILLPGLSKAYIGSNASQYKMVDNTIANNGPIRLPPVQVGLIPYDPIVDELRISISNSSIGTQVYGHCDIKGLTDAYIAFSVTSANPAVFQPPEYLNFPKDPNAVVTSSNHVPWWEKLLMAIFTFGLANAITEIIVACIESSVASAISSTGISGRSMGFLLVQWPGQAAGQVTDGGLLDNFYMRGRVNR